MVVSVNQTKPYNMGAIYLPKAKRSGSFSKNKDIVTHNGQGINSTRYDVVLIDMNKDRTEHHVYKVDNGKWIINITESEPFVQGEIRKIIDKMEDGSIRNGKQNPAKEDTAEINQDTLKKQDKPIK